MTHHLGPSADGLSLADVTASSEGKWRAAEEDALASILNYRFLLALSVCL